MLPFVSVIWLPQQTAQRGNFNASMSDQATAICHTHRCSYPRWQIKWESKYCAARIVDSIRHGLLCNGRMLSNLGATFLERISTELGRSLMQTLTNPGRKCYPRNVSGCCSFRRTPLIYGITKHPLRGAAA